MVDIDVQTKRRSGELMHENLSHSGRAFVPNIFGMDFTFAKNASLLFEVNITFLAASSKRKAMYGY